MSVLETPRAYFRGQITWDPIVTNNYPAFYDTATSRTAYRPNEGIEHFREDARRAIFQGNWNPHGTHRSRLFETRVCAVDTGEGPSTSDPFVGVPVDLLGMLVDLDPLGSITSQLFFDRMTWGIDGGCRISAAAAHRFTARRINFARNPGYPVIAGRASAIWQTSVPKDGLRLASRGSPLLEAFAAALSEDGVLGLTIRMNAYRTVYYGSPDYQNAHVARQRAEELSRRISDGGFHPNPARSLIVGVVGLWRAGEPPAVIGDRFLAASRSVGCASARLEGHKLVLDLANALPETGYEPEKRDLGTLRVVAGSDTPVVLGDLPYEVYDRSAYEATAGIVELPLTAAQVEAAATSDLAVLGRDGLLLSEQRFLACSDHPNVYLDQGEARKVQLRVLDRGRVPGRPLKLTVGLSSGGPLRQALVLDTDADGLVELPLSGAEDGIWRFALLPWEDQPPTSIPAVDIAAVGTTSYQMLRVLDADGDTARKAPTWDNVYGSVLMNWKGMAPCMDNWLDLADEDQCRRYAPLIKRLTSKDAFERYRFMPVTRGLTPGQRELLHAWCDRVMGEPLVSTHSPAREVPRELERRG